MSQIDFTEIPKANSGSGLQDDFELFARDFFIMKGYKVDFAPSRGADLGKDIVLIDSRSGISGNERKLSHWDRRGSHLPLSRYRADPAQEL